MFPGKRVLFVCVENACRSQMAEAFARMHAGEEVEAFSAGSEPSGMLNPTAIELMGELGYDLSAHASKSIDDLPEGPFAAVVTMGCGDRCPALATALREDWPVPDPKAMPRDQFRGVRDLIKQRVHALLARLLLLLWIGVPMAHQRPVSGLACGTVNLLSTLPAWGTVQARGAATST